MLKQKSKAKSLALQGLIAGIYFILTVSFLPLSYGGIQVRFAEGLTILPLLFPEGIVGVTVGCLIANIFGNGILDIVFGSLATLLSAILTYLVGKKVKNNFLKFAFGGLFPVIINAIVVPFTFLVITELKELYFINAIQIFVGQFISVYLVGGIIYFSILTLLNKRKKKEQ